MMGRKLALERMLFVGISVGPLRSVLVLAVRPRSVACSDCTGLGFERFDVFGGFDSARGTFLLAFKLLKARPRLSHNQTFH